LVEQILMRELELNGPTFGWLYRLTWNWSLLDPYLGNIRDKLMSGPPTKAARVASVKEAFFLATQAVANELCLPIDHMGVLFDKWVPIAHAKDGQANHPSERKVADGVMLVIVRELSDTGPDTPNRYTSKGFRMTDPRFVVGLNATKFGASEDLVSETFQQLKTYARRGVRSVVQPNGVYAALFAIRSAPAGQEGGEVLVYNFAHHQIPAFRLPDTDCMAPEALQVFKLFENLSIADVQETCRKAMAKEFCPLLGNRERTPAFLAFVSALRCALDSLVNSIKPAYPGVLTETCISPRLLQLPSADPEAGVAHMIVFCRAC
jgi:hypothetical protein